MCFPEWNLPVEDSQFDIGIADISAEQFTRFSKKMDRELSTARHPTTAVGWHKLLSQRLCTLKEVLQVWIHVNLFGNVAKLTLVSYKALPMTYGVSLELRYPNPVVRHRYHLGHHHEPNSFVDSVLDTVFSVSRSLPANSIRRKIVFSSFVPAICTAVNWKQPNCEWNYLVVMRRFRFTHRPLS